MLQFVKIFLENVVLNLQLNNDEVGYLGFSVQVCLDSEHPI